MYNYPVVISSVIQKEPGFEDYRFIAKLAAESLNFRVIMNNEDAGSTQRGFFHTLEKERPIVIAIFGDKPSEIVIEECKQALENNLKIIPLFKVASSKATVSEAVTEYISKISLPMFKVDCHQFANGQELYNNIVRYLQNYQEELQQQQELSSRHNSIYVKALDLLKNSKREFILCQKTSSLILGPQAGQDGEESFYRALNNWFKNKNGFYSDEHMTFKHMFSLKTTKELMMDSKFNVKQARDNLKQIFSGIFAKNIKLKIELIDFDWNNNYMPFVISDGDLLVNLFFADIEFNTIIRRENIQSMKLKSIPADIGKKGEVLFSQIYDQANIEAILNKIYGGNGI